MKISIIVPVYNGEESIAQAVGDLTSQTHEDLEILLVDDGSRDLTGKICDELAASDSRIRVIHKPNGGAPSARNCGLREATGEYIGFMDADDRADPEMYAALAALAEKYGSDLVACGYRAEYGSFTLTRHHGEIPEPIAFTGKKECLMSIEASPNKIDGYTWNKLYRRERIGELKFCEDMRICDDIVFTYHFLSNAEKVHFINVPFYHYRYVLTSLTKASGVCVYLHELERFQELNDWIAQEAPECIPAARCRYLGWSVKACESMLRDYNRDYYRRIRGNIRKYRRYIPLLPLRMRILSAAAASCWGLYKICAETNFLLKKCYLMAKKG